MTPKVVASPPAGQSAIVDLPKSGRSARADLERWLTQLQEAMRRTEWTPEALDAHWGTSRGYAWRLVSGEKPWSLERVLALPTDVQTELEHLRLESFGRVVIAPLAEGEGLRSLVVGLVSLFGTLAALPTRAGAPIKVDINRRATDRRVSA